MSLSWKLASQFLSGSVRYLGLWNGFPSTGGAAQSIKIHILLMMLVVIKHHATLRRRSQGVGILLTGPRKSWGWRQDRRKQLTLASIDKHAIVHVLDDLEGWVGRWIQRDTGGFGKGFREGIVSLMVYIANPYCQLHVVLDCLFEKYR